MSINRARIKVILDRFLYALLGAIIGASIVTIQQKHEEPIKGFSIIHHAHARGLKIDAGRKVSTEVGNTAVKTETPLETIVRVCKEEGFNDPELLINIAKCESGMNPKAKNKNSSARGLFQVLDLHGLTIEERENPETATRWAVKKIQAGGISAWSESRKCWNK